MNKNEYFGTSTNETNRKVDFGCNEKILHSISNNNSDNDNKNKNKSSNKFDCNNNNNNNNNSDENEIDCMFFTQIETVYKIFLVSGAGHARSKYMPYREDDSTQLLSDLISCFIKEFYPKIIVRQFYSGINIFHCMLFTTLSIVFHYNCFFFFCFAFRCIFFFS